MKSTMRALVLVVLAAVPGASASAFADGTTSAPPAPVEPTHDPDAVKFMRNLEDTIAKQTEPDALVAIKQLVAYWKDPAVKDQTKEPMPGLVAWYARRKSVPVAMAGISGLADIGKGEGSKLLIQLLDDLLDRDPPTPQMTNGVFAALKRVADTESYVIKTLLKLFNYKDDLVVAKAADTLGGYKDAKASLRKDLFEELLRTFEGVASEAGGGPGKTTTNKSAVNKWVAVGGSVLGAMGALAHQQFADMPAARKWMNDHHRDPGAWK